MWVRGLQPDTGGCQVKPMVDTVAEVRRQTIGNSEHENENVGTSHRVGYTGSEVLKSENMAPDFNQ